MEDRRKTTRTAESHDGQTRTELYGRIRSTHFDRLERYYQRHPDRITDQRGRDNQEMIIAMLRDTLNILDEYRIERRG